MHINPEPMADEAVDTRSADEVACGLECGRASAQELRAKAAMWGALGGLFGAAAQFVTAITAAAVEDIKSRK